MPFRVKGSAPDLGNSYLSLNLVRIGRLIHALLRTRTLKSLNANEYEYYSTVVSELEYAWTQWLK